MANGKYLVAWTDSVNGEAQSYRCGDYATICRVVMNLIKNGMPATVALVEGA